MGLEIGTVWKVIRCQEFTEAHEVGDERAPEGRKRVAQGDGEAGALGFVVNNIQSPRSGRQKNGEALGA